MRNRRQLEQDVTLEQNVANAVRCMSTDNSNRLNIDCLMQQRMQEWQNKPHHHGMTRSQIDNIIEQRAQERRNRQRF